MNNVSYQVSANDADEIRICCLFCPDMGESEDTRFRLGINTRTGSGHCFNCGWASAHDAPRQVLLKLGQTEEAGDLEEEEEKDEEEEEQLELPEGFERLAGKQTEYWGRRAKGYLWRRQVSNEQIRLYQIGYTMVGRYQYRVVFPIIWQNELKYFVCRDFTGTAAVRYLNTPGSKPVYGLPDPGHCSKSIVLSEGIFKALAIARVSRDEDSGALLGHSITDLQLEQLKECKYKYATVWPDPDKVGIQGAVDIADKLEDYGCKVSVIWPAPKKQADELPDEVLQMCYQRREKFNWKIRNSMLARAAFAHA